LLKRVAVGGMAELYLAKDTDNGRLVVIKRILPYLAQEMDFVRMFLDEARIAAQLHHPSIITMFELGSLEGSIFIAMEFVEGVDLRKILQQEQKRNQVVPPRIAAWLTARLCEGLHYAHNRTGPDGKPMGIIHRDVSPQNLMVGYRGEVKLVDFGIAKASALMERSKPGVIKGKFLYLSPEQLSQERIDHRSDLFALGTMLYEVCVGKSPFFKPTTEAVIYAIRAEDPPPPHLARGNFPQPLSKVIMKCLMKDRARRYQQADEVRRDLQAWLDAEAPTTREDVEAYVANLFGGEEERTVMLVPPGAE
jgi:serine/threonine-protein kinase